MKDIDFDELDRAVSSVLGGGVPKQDEDSSSTSTAVADADQDGLVDASEPSASSETTSSPQTTAGEVTTDSPDGSRPSQAATPLAIKRRGKFMDVVHPSSDMNPTSTVPMAARKSITPLAVAPTESQEPESDAVAPLDVPSKTEEASAVVAETVTETEVSTSSTLEIAADDSAVAESSVEPETTEQDQPETTKASTEETASVDQPTVDSDQTAPAADVAAPAESLADPSPLESGDGFGASASSTPETPFLSDAKVEKRPLGGFGDNPETADAPSEDAEPDAGVVQTPPPVSLPRELQPDVVKVEAIPDDTQAPADPVETATAPVLATVPAAAGSDGDTHSLFDTSSYHAPIAHAKKSSTPGWVWWMVGLLLCLAAGAGVGYFLFIAGL